MTLYSQVPLLLVRIAVRGARQRAAALGELARRHPDQFAAARDEFESNWILHSEQQLFEGWSRDECAAAYQQVAAWLGSSPAAAATAQRLRDYFLRTWGVVITESAASLDERVVDRLQRDADIGAHLARGDAAYAYAHSVVDDITAARAPAEPGSARVRAALAEWARRYADPGGGGAASARDGLLLALAAAGVHESDSARVVFVIDYLTASASASTFASGSIVDVSKESRGRIDAQLLKPYQQLLASGQFARAGVLRTQLREAITVLAAEDRERVLQRQRDIYDSPDTAFEPLWTILADRDHMAGQAQTYVDRLRELLTYDESPLDDDAAVIAADLLALRRELEDGIGLDEIETRQIELTLGQLDAGTLHLPGLLFADDRSSRLRDRQRAEDIAERVAMNARLAVEAALPTPVPSLPWVRNTLDTVEHTVTLFAAGAEPQERNWRFFDQDMAALSRDMQQAFVSDADQLRAANILIARVGQAHQVGAQAQMRDFTWEQRIAVAAQLPVRELHAKTQHVPGTPRSTLTGQGEGAEERRRGERSTPASDIDFPHTLSDAIGSHGESRPHDPTPSVAPAATANPDTAIGRA